MRRPRVWFLAAVLALAGALLVVGCRDDYDALRMMADLGGVGLLLPDGRTPPARSELRYADEDGAQRLADVYQPGAPARAGLVLVPGASPGGRNDARLVEFANTLARSGFLVLVPEIASLRELRPDPASSDDIAAAVVQVHAMQGGPGAGAVGIGAFSVAVGPAVLAALRPDVAAELDFMLLVGGYHDLTSTLAYLTTGYYRDDQRLAYREPNAYGKWVYALTNAQRLQDPGDRAALREMARRKLDDPAAEVGDLLAQLSPQARTVYDLITNTDPARVATLIEQLPPRVREDIEQLDLSRQRLFRVHGQCILVHGIDDDVIPYTQTVALAAALSGCRVEVHLLRGLQHVDRRFQGLDAWRFWRVLASLMALRG